MGIEIEATQRTVLCLYGWLFLAELLAKLLCSGKVCVVGPQDNLVGCRNKGGMLPP